MTNFKANTQDQGMIFDIERFSTRDGPGIRTVVFFKGCNLHCYWCHNPESMSTKPQLSYDARKCIGCESCVAACPHSAISFIDGVWHIDHSLCTLCFDCVAVCCSGALQCVGENLTIDEILEEILEDKPFYQNSGGGVTLSGGEVTIQSEFAARLLEACKREGIHTAIDSNMTSSWKRYQEVLPYTDLVLADIKSMDAASQKKATGISNKIVLENIQRIADMGVPLIVRTPVIPGFNDTEENFRATGEFLKPLGSLVYYELLSYNPLGEEKVKKFGLEQKEKITALSKEEMKKLAEAALQSGIRVFIDGIEQYQ